MLTKEHLGQIKEFLASIKPMKAVFEQAYVKKLTATHVKKGKSKGGPGRAAHGRHRRSSRS